MARSQSAAPTEMTARPAAPRTAPGRWLSLVTLLVVGFAAGLIVARLPWGAAGEPAPPEAEVARGAAAPATPTAVPATPTPLRTPTPAGGAAELPTLYIDIAPDDFAQIRAKRAEALESWILMASSADFVPASLRLDQAPPLDVRLRLKGDWGDHFGGDKWSYRIETRGGDAVLGMRVFSIQDPSTRAYLDEWLFLENARTEDVLSVGYRFVHGVQNGTYMGVYAVEEGFSKELLESQSRRESVIIRFNEDLLWAYWSAYEHDKVTPRGVEEVYVIDEFDSGKVARDPGLAAQREAAVGKLRAWWRGELPAGDVFDIAKLARFWALSDLWGAHHAVRWHNLRFYYNPVTTLLEPIAFDTQPLVEGIEVDVRKLPGLAQVRAYDDPQLYRLYVQALWRLSRPAYLDALQAAYAGELAQLQDALAPEFGEQQTPAGQPVLAAPWEALATRQAALREFLAPIQATYAYRPADVPTTTLAIDVGNILDLPVEVVGVQVGEQRLPADPAWVSAADAARLVPAEVAGGALVLPPLAEAAAFADHVRLELPPEAATAPVTLETRLWGLTTTVTQTVAPAYPMPSAGPRPLAPPLDAFLAAYSDVRVLDGDAQILTLPPGTHIFTTTFNLPEGYGLRLEAGTTLRFAPDAYLLARGPLVFAGTEAAPVVLGPSEDAWPGLLVLNAGAPSYWNDVVIEPTAGFAIPGWGLTGAVTFYESPVWFERVHFAGTATEDELNIIRAEFHIADSVFANTASDAIDVDFGEGDIVRTTFHDIAADAVDVSGTRLRLEDIYATRLGDKGVSIGEGSHLVGERITVVDADYGIASKDLSEVTVRTVTIDGARIAALAAYIKKPEYGPATITATDVTLVNVPTDQVTLVQTGSWIDLEGERIWGTDVDVDALYRKWK